MEKNRITLSKINNLQNKICGNFVVVGTDEFISCFKKPYKFDLEYGINIDLAPNSLLIVPFVANVLPIIWLFDAVLELNELDSTFYNSVENIKKGYENMYPNLSFKGHISVNKLVKNNNQSEKSVVLFSGGVDAYQTLISHIKENPYLITLWGADININNEKGWMKVKRQLKQAEEHFGLTDIIVKTNFREYIDEENLSCLVNSKKSNYKKPLGWYHDFQHGISIISHVAPLLNILNIGTAYIASSFTKEDIGKYTCASDPTIDNYVRFGNTIVIHDGFEFSRQKKINNLAIYHKMYNKQIPLRVCWITDTGENCCNCEKCYRTILAILVEKQNPVDFGFRKYSEQVRKRMLYDIRYKYFVKYETTRYKPIQTALKNNYTLENCPKDFLWLYKLNFKGNRPLIVKLYCKIRSLAGRLVRNLGW